MDIGEKIRARSRRQRISRGVFNFLHKHLSRTQQMITSLRFFFLAYVFLIW